MKKTSIFLMLFLFSLTLFSQDESTNTADTLRKDALNVYMDASSYLKQKIPYINYVRDIKVADLVIISASERTGSGGREYTLFLEGQGKCAGMIDTIKYSTSPDETYEQRRDKEVKNLEMGLIRYVLKTPLAQYMDIKFTEPISSEVSTDKWNNWVFKTSLSGYTYGQSTFKSSNASGRISASRVTEDWKLDFSSRYSSGKDEFEIDDEIYKSTTILKSANALVVKSINNHWSIGGNGSVLSSTYSNYDLRVSVMPGIEYNVFPYSESTRRQFRFLYSIGYMYNNYTDTTIFNKVEEGLFSQSLSGSFEVIQKWGGVDLSVSWSNYLRDFSENSLSLDGYISWRIAKGLSVDIGGSFTFIHNQISLVKGGASTEEILLRRKELETDYNYFMHFGFSYTFGSIYNNVVNPRFGSSGGGGMMIMY